MGKATFTIGVFGLACRNDNGVLRIKVNVRTDQEKQRGPSYAELPAGSSVLIIDCPGGGGQVDDFTCPQPAHFEVVLRREILEETRGCTLDLLGPFSEPYLAVNKNPKPDQATGDLAFWVPIRLHGTPRPSDEALAHPWITLEELEAETVYRAVGKLGKEGRTARMIKAGFAWFGARMADEAVFSKPD